MWTNLLHPKLSLVVFTCTFVYLFHIYFHVIIQMCIKEIVMNFASIRIRYRNRMLLNVFIVYITVFYRCTDCANDCYNQLCIFTRTVIAYYYAV